MITYILFILLGAYVDAPWWFWLILLLLVVAEIIKELIDIGKQ